MPVTKQTNKQVLDKAKEVSDRIASESGVSRPGASSTPTTAVTQEQADSMTTQQLSQALAQPIASPVPVDQITPTTIPQLPEPTAVIANEALIGSVASDVVTAKTSLGTILDKDKTVIDEKISTLQKEQEDILASGQALTEPFRLDLENAERERLSINENFDANQKLVSELESLLNEGNELIRISKGRAVSNTVLNKSVSKTITDVNARAGVIQAVMSARSGQIAEAERLIDRSVAAIAADRQDELGYYDTLLSLNDSKLIKLDSESKKIAEDKRAMAQSDLDNAQATADYIKGLMINPQTAQFMADAGVTLNDSIEEIQTKMAKQSKIREIQDFQNSLVDEGYDISPVKEKGSITFKVGGETIYAKVRPGSELYLKNKAQQALVNQRNRVSGSTIFTPSGETVTVPTFEEWAKENGGKGFATQSLTDSQMENLRKDYASEIDLINTANQLKSISNFSREILKNPQGFFNITPTERGKVLRELANAGIDTASLQNGKKRALSATQSDDLIQAQIARNGIVGLKDKLDELRSTGPIVGGIRQLNPFDDRVVAIMAEITRIIPGLARGVFKEVGVLTDADMDRYRSTLANPSSTPTQINQLHNDTMQKIDDSLNIIYSTYNDLGYDLRDFSVEDIINPVEETVVDDGLSEEEAYAAYLETANQEQ